MNSLNLFQDVPMPLLSIIIPTYNYGHFLPDAITSIARQTFPTSDFELIIIDDGSTDNTPQITKDFAKHFSFIRVVRYEKNKGLHFAVNHSFDLAQGEYIHWLSADDFRAENFLQKTMEALLQHPSISICCSDFGYVDEKMGRSHLQSFPLLTGVSTPTVYHTEQLVQLFQKTKFWIPGHTTIAKKSTIIKYGKYNKKLLEKCDWFLFHQIALHEGIIYIPEVLSYLYSHQNSYSSQMFRAKSLRKAIARELLSTLDRSPQTRKLFYRAALLGWVYRDNPIEFIKPIRWMAFLILLKKKMLKLFKTLL